MTHRYWNVQWTSFMQNTFSFIFFCLFHASKPTKSCCALAVLLIGNALVSDQWSPRLGLGQRIAWQGFDLLIKHWGFSSPNWFWAPKFLSWENFEASHDILVQLIGIRGRSVVMAMFLAVFSSRPVLWLLAGRFCPRAMQQNSHKMLNRLGFP